MPTGTGSAFIKHLLKILKAIKPPKMGLTNKRFGKQTNVGIIPHCEMPHVL